MNKITLSLFFIVLTSVSYSQTTNCCFGVRFGIGTDLSPGISYKAEFDFRLADNFDIGALFLATSSLKSWNSGTHDYTEKRRVYFYGAIGTWLIHYRPEEAKLYYLLSAGGGIFYYDLQKSSSTDGLLGTPLPGGGSRQSIFVNQLSIVAIPGVGHSFKSPFGLRFEVPLLIPIDNGVGVVPLFQLTAGIEF